MVRLTEDEMLSMNKTSVALRDGSGYIGYLESYHMLHCVKRLYQFQYREHYPKLADELTIHHLGKCELASAVYAIALLTSELEHCMEVLREGIMCNADVTANTYIWNPEEPTKLKGQNMQPRKCVDWSSLEKWTDERAIGGDHEKMVQYDEPGSIGPAELL